MTKSLDNKTITEILIADDKKAILIRTTDGDVFARCDAECCSYTWVESIELPVNGFPADVLKAEEIEMPDLGNGDAECVSYYGFKITTSKGDIIIDYRNESNGYYGGNLVWPDDSYFYGGVHGQNVSDGKWVQARDAAVLHEARGEE